jgi:hypothetical protein
MTPGAGIHTYLQFTETSANGGNSGVTIDCTVLEGANGRREMRIAMGCSSNPKIF